MLYHYNDNYEFYAMISKCIQMKVFNIEKMLTKINS